jgi:hypothetical protein
VTIFGGVMMKKKNRLDRQTRRMLSALWCRICRGEECWEDSAKVAIIGSVYVGVIVAVCVLLFPGSASGDVLVWSDYVGADVHAEKPVVIPLPEQIGYLSFSQAETHAGVPSSGAAYMAIAPVFIGDTAIGAVALHVFDQITLGFLQVIWDQQSRPIGYTQSREPEGILWGGGAALPSWVAGDGDPDDSESPVLIPWQWEVWGDTFRRGVGWVSVSHIRQSVPLIGESGADWSTGSGFRIEYVALAELSEDLWLGVLPGQPAAVPEPSTLVVGLVVGLVAWWRVRR